MFSQRAVGTFEPAVAGEFHCGPDHTSPKLFNWEVRLQWPDAALDPNGFLLDNMSFREYFNAIEVLTDSCELVTIKAAKHFTALAPAAGKVTVTIEVPGLAKVSNTQS